LSELPTAVQQYQKSKIPFEKACNMLMTLKATQGYWNWLFISRICLFKDKQILSKSKEN